MRRTFDNSVLYLFLAFLTASHFSLAQIHGGGEANPGLKTNASSLERWQEMRFGMFIHWGPVTLRGTEIGWSRGTQVPIQEYDDLYRQFNPVLFDAQKWVGLAKAAGMKYLVITSKHHDGFCLWNSKYTDYTIAHTPFQRDVLKELSEECDRQGILFCTYYSILDWHHPDYTTRYGGDPRPVQNSDMNIYRSYLKNQIGELISNYHTQILWFDGEWEQSWTHEDGMDLYASARNLNNDVLINNRVDKGRVGMKGMTVSDRFAGDFGTPEQEIGAFDNTNPWESCITICTQWSWKPNDKLKSLKECIQILARTAGGGGNLLLNISPGLDGRIEQRQIDRLLEIGKWMEKNGESIYGTRGGPYKSTDWFASTNKGSRVYLHVLRTPKDELRLPALPGRRVKQAKSLGGDDMRVITEGGQLVVAMPHRPTDENDFVISVDFDGPVAGLEPLEVPANVFPEAETGGVSLATPPSPAYAGKGAKSLVDSVRGSTLHTDGNWLGFERRNFEAVIDVHSARVVNGVGIGCLQNQQSWIFLPKSVEVFVSENGTTFRSMGKTTTGQPRKDGDVVRKEIIVTFKKVKARYIKVRAINVGTCPDWHPGAGGDAWIFVDEIAVR